MKDFRFTCPHCTQRMRCDGRLAGRRVRCPCCRRGVLLLAANNILLPDSEIVRAEQSADKQA